MIAILTGIAFALALGLLLTFFVTGNTTADRIANMIFLAFYALAAVVVYQVDAAYATQNGAVWIITAIAIATLAVLFVSQAAVLVGATDFKRVALLQTAGFAIYILWILAASFLALSSGTAVIGWLGIVVVAVTLAVLGWFARDAALIRGDRQPNVIESALGLLPFVGVSAWLVLLGIL